MMFRLLRSAIVTLIALSLVVTSLLVTRAQEATPAAECPTTTPEENEALAIMALQESVWGDQGVMADLVSPEWIHHWSTGDETTGLEAFQERLGAFLAAFPNLEYHPDLVAAEGDLAAIISMATGSHSGDWQGIAPTGRDVSWTGIMLFRIECGLIVESWGEADLLGLSARLGALDVPAFLATPVVVSPSTAATPCADDTPEANVAAARRWTEEVINQGQLEVLDEIVDPGIVHHGASFPDAQGPGAVKEALRGVLAAFPENLTVEATVADGDIVFVRYAGQGTHDGAFLGIEPTGTDVRITGINAYRLSCGRIVESWSEINGLDLLRQIQEPAAATPAA
jgi:predicted ester cyclase